MFFVCFLRTTPQAAGAGFRREFGSRDTRRATVPLWQGRTRAHSSRLFFHGLRLTPKSAVGGGPPAQDAQDLAVLLVEGGGLAALDQVGAVPRGAAEGLVPAPAGDLPVVAAEQHVRDAPAAPLRGLRVDRPL